uniref:Potassium voltage-gated channel subfamily B member 2 n=1 Tax=Phallusia mammillata TaxID=59560 RepID=A0A6F9DFS9_9ASCI|nr:potassium voltage-gated channel subfamily B member 2 [Phallusia mammillata]
MEINIGGKVFRLSDDHLSRLPTSRLAIMYRKRSKVISNQQSNVYFDRNPETFECILAAYRGGQVHAPKSICPIQLQEEMMFWFIDESLLDACCCERLEMALAIIKKNEKNMTEKMTHYALKQQKIRLLTKIQSWEDFTKNMYTMRLRLWSVAEDPSSSTFAKIWMLTSITFILISLAVFVLGTVDGYYTVNENGEEHEIQILSDVEMVCMAWFTFEYIVRFTVSLEKFKFLRQFLNIIDVLTIIPFFVETFSHSAETGSTIETWIHMTQLLRILRIVRIFRLGRHSEGLKLLCVTLYQSSNELVMLSIYLFIGIIILATSLYILEGEELFSNLYEALWFSAVTITTVGYGDIAPKTVTGKNTKQTVF